MSFRRTIIALVLSTATLLIAVPTAQAASVQTISTTDASIDYPRLALTDSGRAYVDWQVFDPSRPVGSDQFAQVATVGADGAATAPSDIGGGTAAIAAGPGDEATELVYAFDGSLQLQRVAPDGTLSEPQVVTPAAEGVAALAVGPTGTATVAWATGQRDISVARVDADGTVHPERVIETVRPPEELQVFTDTRDRTTVAFDERTGPTVVRIAPSGALGPRDHLNSSAWELDADVTGKGWGALAWRSSRGVFVATLSQRGKLSRPELASSGSGRRLFDPRIAVDPKSGEGIVAWTSQSAGDGRRSRSVVYATFGRKGDPAKPRTVARHSRGPAVAFGAGKGGKVPALAWTSKRGIAMTVLRSESGKPGRIKVVSRRRGDKRGLAIGYDRRHRPTLVWLDSAGVELARP
jgi:hypothetical protein